MNDWYIDRSKNFINDSLDDFLQYLATAPQCRDTSLLIDKMSANGLFDRAGGNPNAALTRLRDHGLLSMSNAIGGSALDYVKGRLGKADLTIDLFIKRPCKKQDAPNAKPFVMLCKFFDNMMGMSIDPDDIFITYYECYEYLYPCNGYEEVSFDLVEKVLAERKYDLGGKYPKPHKPLDGNEKTNLSIWFNALKETPVFMPHDNDSPVLRPNLKQKEFFRFISVNADEFAPTPTIKNGDLYSYYCKRETGLNEILPNVVRSNVTANQEEIRILFEYLFGYKKVAVFDYSKFIRYECFGLFFPFITLPKLIIRHIYMSNPKLGEEFYAFIATNNGYILDFEQGKFEYKGAFSMKNEGLNTASSQLKFHTGYQSEFVRNRILFGAPGTGKSFTLNKEKDKLLVNGGEYERVTFNPDYSYANFVGTYKPVMTESRGFSELDEDTQKVISILNNRSKNAQDKYELLFEHFKNEGLKGITRLPILLGLYTDEDFKTKKLDGSAAANENSVERNHGKAIRKYVNLITEKDNDNAKDIAYEYVPGPFMRTYVKALKNARTDTPKPYLLIIEEINRANVAAVFGDVFQLLDRGDNFVSEYPIQTSEDIKKYLAKELGGKPDDYSEIRIPDNMFIWATMNSADQGVFPMDTAFKRRWDFTYLGIDAGEGGIRGKRVVLGTGANSRLVEWNELRKAINNELITHKINEDKLIGPYFLSIKAFLNGDVVDSKEFCRVFKSKVIMYLFDDAAKQKRNTLFSGCDEQARNQYSKICAAFDTKGVNIFCENIRNKFIDIPKDHIE